MSKISKLILLLGSDQIGEAAAAASALRRHLQAMDHDLHDLARIAELHLAPAEMNVPGRKPWQAEAADILARGAGIFPEREYSFLLAMTRWKNQPSESQQTWLADIAARIAETSHAQA